MKLSSAILLAVLVAGSAVVAIEIYTPPTPQSGAVEVDLAALAKQRAEWPSGVTLTKDCNFPTFVNGKQTGVAPVSSGTALRLVAVDGEQIRVLYQGVTNRVPASATDLVETVSARRQHGLRNKVSIDGHEYQGIQSVVFEPPKTVILNFVNGSNGFPQDKVPEKFLEAWGITTDAVATAKIKYAQDQQNKTELAKIREMETLYGPRPPVDPKDGSVPMAKEYLKHVLADPKSTEYLSWRGPLIEKVKGVKLWVVHVRTRGKNAVGAVGEQEVTVIFQDGKPIGVQFAE